MQWVLLYAGAVYSPNVRQSHEVSQKETLLQALSTLSTASSIEHTSLDLSRLSGCGDICLETTLQVSA